MEVIRIPQVSLVDAAGIQIGIYSDDPDWWQRLKQIDIAQSQSEQGSNAQLIKDDAFSDKKLNLNESMKSRCSAKFCEESECNVIGETPLHIAIMYDDLASLKILIEEKGFDVNQRNLEDKFSGGFNSKFTSNLIQQSKYDGLAYYGEYPLAFAACFANKEIYDYLIEKGADPNLQGLTQKNISNKLNIFLIDFPYELSLGF